MTDAATPAADPPNSLQELRPLHVKLLQEWAGLDPADKGGRAEGFRRMAAAAGAWIKNPDERDSVQGLIDYWTATMAGLPELDAYPEMLTLAPFDPKTVRSSRDECPYRGLNPFRTEDRELFFGREAACEALLAAVRGQALVVISAPSGVGKTSLVQAGAAARLAEDGAWTVLPTLAPGRDPLAALLRAVRPKHASNEWIGEQRRLLARNPAILRDLVEAELPPERGAVLIVDRVEELFTAEGASDDSGHAVAALAALVAGNPGRHRAMLTVTPEHQELLLGALKGAGLEPAGPALFSPDPPNEKELEEAIVRPAEAYGRTVETAVVEDLVRESVGQSDALPLLELTLTLLWRRTEIDRICWPDYLAVGKPSQIVQSLADTVYDLLPPGAQECARAALLEMLRPGTEISLARVRRDDLYLALKMREQETDGLAAALDAFIDAGLVRCIGGEDSGDDRFEIAHEAVVRRWPRLVLWLEARRSENQTRERLIAAAELWRRGGRRRGHLLTGAALKPAYVYIGTSRLLDDYIAASKRWQFFQRAMVVAALLFVLTATSLREWFAAWRITEAFSEQEDAQGEAREALAFGDDLDRQSELSDQTLLRLYESGQLGESELPDIFLRRLGIQPQPRSWRRQAKGYDLNFLSDPNAPGQPLALPRPSVRRSGLRVLHYPHMTILYDAERRIPLVAATNYVRDMAPLEPFQGVGFFPDGRLAVGQQSARRTSTDRNYGRVPLPNWNEVSWRPTDSRVFESSFIHMMPVSVLQPWHFFHTAWSSVERRLLGIDAPRITFFTGPVLRPNDPVVGGVIAPRSFWKIAVHRDAETGLLTSQAYLIDVRTPEHAVPQSLTTVAAVAAATGLHFGELGREGTAPPAAAGDVPTVYLQFAALPRSNALEISRVLSGHGYTFPPEERVAAAEGLHEVRFVHPEDEEEARALAQRTEDALAQLGYGEVQVGVRALPGLVKNPRPGVLELWIGIPAPTEKGE